MSSAIVPVPKTPIHIRTATMDDLPFMDSLQKKNSKALGYFPLAQFRGYIEAGHVLVAEGVDRCQLVVGSAEQTSSLATTNYQPPTPLGYLISKDRYLKRDELGVIFQLCIAPGAQRKLIGATLVKAAFERSAYGCRLYCLWCAQDLDANYFWESLGFVPIAFRTGSLRRGSGRGATKKGCGRVHIFWQKKIGADEAAAGWWYPFQTAGGAIRADRVVFPIPEGVSWRDVRPVEIPQQKQIQDSPRSHGGTEARLKVERASVSPCLRGEVPPGKVGILVGGRIKYVDRPGYKAPIEAPLRGSGTSVPLLPAPKGEARPKVKTAKPRAARIKLDPKFLQAARELRDRYLEHVNTREGAGLLESRGKYDVRRQRLLSATATQKPLLPAA